MTTIMRQQKRMTVFRGCYVPVEAAAAMARASPRKLSDREKKLKRRVEQICRQQARTRPGEFLSARELFPGLPGTQRAFTRLLHSKILFCPGPFDKTLQVSSGHRDGRLWEGVRYVAGA